MADDVSVAGDPGLESDSSIDGDAGPPVPAVPAQRGRPLKWRIVPVVASARGWWHRELQESSEPGNAIGEDQLLGFVVVSTSLLTSEVSDPRHPRQDTLRRWALRQGSGRDAFGFIEYHVHEAASLLHPREISDSVRDGG